MTMSVNILKFVNFRKRKCFCDENRENLRCWSTVSRLPRIPSTKFPNFFHRLEANSARYQMGALFFRYNKLKPAQQAEENELCFLTSKSTEHHRALPSNKLNITGRCGTSPGALCSVNSFRMVTLRR